MSSRVTVAVWHGLATSLTTIDEILHYSTDTGVHKSSLVISILLERESQLTDHSIVSLQFIYMNVIELKRNSYQP